MLEEADTTVSAPAIVEASRVWARNQHVTALVVPQTGAPEAVRSAVDSLASLFDRRYRQWAQSRMYFSGHNTALADTLRELAGFALDLPEVYRWRQSSDSVFFFLNDNPDASQLVRWLTVTWRDTPSAEITAEAALAWRDSIGSQLYDWSQRTVPDRLQTTPIDQPGARGLAVRGAWTGTVDELPAGRPVHHPRHRLPQPGSALSSGRVALRPRQGQVPVYDSVGDVVGEFRVWRRPAAVAGWPA